MRHHIKIFESEAAYTAYKRGDDVWLPRVAFVPTTPTAISNITVNTPGRLIFHELGEHFVEVCNGGVMHFFDKYDASNNEWYTATYDSSGVLNLNIPDGKYSYVDGVLDITNYPQDDDDDLVVT